MNNLIKACISGDTELLARAFRHGGKLNTRYRGWKPVRWAIQYGHLGIVMLLVDRGTNIKKPYSDGFTPLDQAVGENHRGIVKYLISAGVDVNQRSANGTALHTACAYGHTAIVKLLLKEGADPKIRDDGNRTPRYYARRYNNLDIVELLDGL